MLLTGKTRHKMKPKKSKLRNMSNNEKNLYWAAAEVDIDIDARLMTLKEKREWWSTVKAKKAAPTSNDHAPSTTTQPPPLLNTIMDTKVAMNAVFSSSEEEDSLVTTGADSFYSVIHDCSSSLDDFVPKHHQQPQPSHNLDVCSTITACACMRVHVHMTLLNRQDTQRVPATGTNI